MRKGLFISLCFIMLLATQARASVTLVSDTIRDTVTTMKAHKPEKVNKHYLSLNTTFFIKQLLSFTNGAVTVTASPYIFEYKFLHKNHGIRLGIGGNLSNQKTTTDQNQVSLSKASTFDLRLGYVYQAQLGKRWSYFAGFDVTAQTTKSLKTDNTVIDVVTTNAKGYSVGFGPSFGIQISFSKRVGLFTESAIYYAFNNKSNTTTSSNFPDLNTSEKTVGNSIQFVIPTSIYFYVRF